MLAVANDFPRFDLTGDVALVTGAGRGLGRAISLALAHAGADVALGLRDVKTGGELAREIEAIGRRVLPLQMDMTRLDQISRAVNDTAAHFGRLDILVNNAGVYEFLPLEQVTEQHFRRLFDTNVLGLIVASREAELSGTHDLGADPAIVQLHESVVDAVAPASLAGHLAPPLRGELPLMQLSSGVTERCLVALPFTGAEAVE